VVALLNVVNRASHFYDDTGPFVAKDDVLRYGHPTVTSIQIGMAQSGGDDSNQYLIRSGRAQDQLLHAERCTKLADDCCRDLHHTPPGLRQLSNTEARATTTVDPPRTSPISLGSMHILSSSCRAVYPRVL
jgi:hypothetical protein